MAYQTKANKVTVAAMGNRGSVPKTPPTRVIPTQPDAVSSVRRPILPGGYGQNQYEGPSSTELSKVPVSGLGANMTASADPDGTLDAVIHGGVQDDADWQTRKVDATPLATAHGQKSRQSDDGSPGGTVPAALGAPATALPKPYDAKGK